MNKLAVKDLLNIFAWIAVGGAMVWGYQAATAKQADKSSVTAAASAQRKANVKATLAAGPQTRTWETPEGRVIQLNIPSASFGGHMVHMKKCIVWSGASALAVAMSCEPDAIDLAYDEPDGPDYSDLR